MQRNKRPNDIEQQQKNNYTEKKKKDDHIKRRNYGETTRANADENNILQKILETLEQQDRENKVFRDKLGKMENDIKRAIAQKYDKNG